MREIKFRGFATKGQGRDNKMVYGSCYFTKRGLNGILIHFIGKNIDTDEELHIRIHPGSVGLYTGLKDSTKWEDLSTEEKKDWIDNDRTEEEWKGKEIYEGDILQTADKDFGYTPSYVVIEPLLGFGVRLKRETGHPWNGQLSTWLDHNPKIIGDIHQNPELLKE